MAKKLILLGATGDIGTQTLDILRFQYDYDLVGVAFHSHYEKLEEYLFFFDKLTYIAIEEEKAAQSFLFQHPSFASHLFSGKEAIKKLLLSVKDATVFNAISGNDGIRPTLYALENQQDLLLANKESYLVGSSLMKEKLKYYHGHLYPVDSEHVGLYKCLHAVKKEYQVDSLMITASGGALRDISRDELPSVTKEQVLSHPTWKMSNKITIDCSTLVNKGYEMIEASEMYSFPLSKIHANLCRSSLIHAGIKASKGKKEIALYEYSPCTMKVAITFALSKGKCKLHHVTKEEEKDYEHEVSLLRPVDEKRYPLFRLTMDCYQKFGNPGMFYYNAVDKEAIDCFLQDEINYLEIESSLFYLYQHMPPLEKLTEDNVEKMIEESEKFAVQLLNKKPWRSQ